jgi:monoterpene epsilon-lactone hydrolase
MSTAARRNTVFGDFSGITTQVYIQMGGAEGLLGENMAVADRLRQGGVAVDLEVFPEMQHVFQQGAGYIPESDAALRKIGGFLRPLLKT